MHSVVRRRQPFGQPPPKTSSKKLVALIRSAYWVALCIIAAMTMASFLLLQQMMAAQQRDAELLSLVSAQKALSQRVVFLANALDNSMQREQSGLISSLRKAVSEFQSNQDRLLKDMNSVSDAARHDPTSVENVLFEGPHHLDQFSRGLIDNGWRLISALETWAGIDDADYRAGIERAMLDATVANAALEGFTALGSRLGALSDERLDRMLALHHILFYATLAIIVLVALFIFRPMSVVIQRRTDELMEARNSMSFLAVHDRLTGLHNRAFLNDHFDELITDAARRKERMAVMQIDLDRFKKINDTLGHAAGDYVLVVTAQRLREACRASDLSVRLGGDEFVIVLQGAGTTDDIDTVARRILSRINEPVIFQGATVMPSASAGIAVYPVDGDNARDLLVHADLALYAAKKNSGFTFFSGELRRELEHRKKLEIDLRKAIAERAFQVHFQPQVSMTTGAIAGIEALARWRHEERGMIAPGEFIPIAEKSGLMAEVGRIVIAKAIHAAAGWHKEGLVFGRLAVNVSSSELHEADFDKFLFDTLESEGLPPEKLSLEIVESVILDDEKTGIAAKLRHIRAAGVHLELDDFGTGYASLSHVNPNEIDRLKIDRRFVQNIDANTDNGKIVRAITELARGLGIAIVAEGAETQAELNSLKSIGCDDVQGYSIALPMPAEQAGEWLSQRRFRKPRLTLLHA
jgi:diguanylate cyclase (GGDEF)-like protein